MKIKRNFWLSNPAGALNLNFEDPDRLFVEGTLLDPSTSMTDYGWVLLGEAEVHLTITKYPDAILRDALAATKAALAKMDAEHEVKRNHFLDLIGKFQSIGWNGKVE